jgi:hypothetical protein
VIAGTYLRDNESERLAAMRQSGLTVITEIEPARVGALPGVLRAAERRDPFGSMRGVHYAAFVMLPEIDGIRARLVMETNFDGELDDHLDELVRHGADVLDDIYANCKDYTPASARNQPQSFKDYLIKNSVPSTAYYVALPGRARDDICNAIEVYQTAQEYLDKRLAQDPAFCDLDQDQVWFKLVEHFRTAGAPKPILSTVSRRGLRWRAGLNALMLLPGLLVLLPILLLIARVYECREARTCMKRRFPIDPKVYKYLNLGRQNHMCTLATVKLSRFRALMIRLGLFVAKVLARKVFILGKLDTITTIHFARWTLIDGNRHVLFLSNFDGTWSNYLDDFSDPPHLNALWSNTERFPPTRFMFWEGARHIEQFQAHVVEEFQPTFFFHRPYGDHSVENLLRYLQLRDELARAIKKGGRRRHVR